MNTATGYVQGVYYLHGNAIYDSQENKINFCGWPTATTRKHLNKVMPKNWKVFQADSMQYLESPNGRAKPIPINGWVDLK